MENLLFLGVPILKHIRVCILKLVCGYMGLPPQLSAVFYQNRTTINKELNSLRLFIGWRKYHFFIVGIPGSVSLKT